MSDYQMALLWSLVWDWKGELGTPSSTKEKAAPQQNSHTVTLNFCHHFSGCLGRKWTSLHG